MFKKKNNIFFSLLVLLIFTNAWSKILIERYEDWKHPVLIIFKKYDISVYKVSYSLDGKHPTFYAKFKYSPDTRSPDANSFYKVYFEVLKANSCFPYSIIDYEDNIAPPTNNQSFLLTQHP